MQKRISITRLEHNGVPEFNAGVVRTLTMVEAMTLIEILGYHPCHSDNGTHSWFASVGRASDNIRRPITLTVDRWGDAVLATSANLVFTWTLEGIMEHLPPASEMIVAIPC